MMSVSDEEWVRHKTEECRNPNCDGEMTCIYRGKSPAVPRLDPYFIKAIEHARLRLLKEPRCGECTTTIEAFDKLIEAAGGPQNYA